MVISGHVFRMDEKRIPPQAWKWIPMGKMKRWRPRMTLRRTVQRDMQTGNLSGIDLNEKARDRARWRALLSALWDRTRWRALLSALCTWRYRERVSKFRRYTSLHSPQLLTLGAAFPNQGKSPGEGKFTFLRGNRKLPSLITKILMKTSLYLIINRRLMMPAGVSYLVRGESLS